MNYVQGDVEFSRRSGGGGTLLLATRRKQSPVCRPRGQRDETEDMHQRRAADAGSQATVCPAVTGRGHTQNTKDEVVAAGLSARSACARLSLAWRSRSWHSCRACWNCRQASSRMELLRVGLDSQ